MRDDVGIRRWLSDILRALWLRVKTGRRSWPDSSFVPDPFRWAAALVMVDGRLVTRISDDDLEALAALVDTADSIVAADEETGLAELRIRLPGPQMAERLDLSLSGFVSAFVLFGW